MLATREFNVGSVPVGGSRPLFLIAGPCVIESPEHCRMVARELKSITTRCDVPFIFKASFDKANRTSSSSFRGPGIQQGLEVLVQLRRELQIPVLTDIHEVEQVKPVAEVVDCLQIPAFLCRQTDLLLAAGQTGCAVNVKKGQFLAPWDMENVVKKLETSGCKRVLLTERGTSFGYNNLVVDMRSFPVMRQWGWPVVYDVTHSLQLPGGQGTASGGQLQFIENLARAGVGTGIDGLFIEVHEDPAKALSDGPNALPLERLEALLLSVKQIHAIVNEAN
jgi:2-dehydro-3-deoxyphosphooctonate aldolase (KDO 8-P synthase)